MSGDRDDHSPDSEPNPWPLYVRVLAVMHVLSIPIGVIGWFRSALCWVARVQAAV